MMKVMGFKRALILAVMVGINLLIAAIYFLFIQPAQTETQNNLYAVEAQISELSTKIQNVKIELATFAENYARYQKLNERGFFLGQDRFQAGRNLDDLQARSGLIGYSYRLEAIKAISNPDAETVNASLINTRVTIERIISVLDTNVYTLMYNIATIFPEHARIQRLEIKRTNKLEENIMRDLPAGKTGLVEASIVMDWLTVVPKAEAAATGASLPGQATGFRGR
jgi:hypothetical protein